ncbi:hypothetical protein A0257_07825 [Hymenobacter psoromatis]|nr:hypothetical protein A0257_07825 [Hymenobacter psoromatis]
MVGATVPRVKLFSGPNRSGKLALLEELGGQFNLGVYINADEIEKLLNRQGFLHAADYQLQVSHAGLDEFLASGQTAAGMQTSEKLGLRITENIIVLRPEAALDSYVAATVADFLRHQLLANSISFTFESVMSHRSKLDFLRLAASKGYRTYLSRTYANRLSWRAKRSNRPRTIPAPVVLVRLPRFARHDRRLLRKSYCITSQRKRQR